MIPILGQLINKQYTYEAILCDPRKNELTILNYTDLTYSPKFKSYSELDIELQYYEEGHLKVKDKNFDLTKGLYLIKLNIKNGDDIVKSEFFFIENPSKNMSDGTITKSLHCYSYEYLVFNKKKLRGYNQTRKLFDPVNDYDYNDTTKGGILNLMFKNLYNTWSIGYINPVFLNVYHTFDFTDFTYTEVFDELQKGYNCVFIFDNVNQTVSVYTNEELGVNTGMVLYDQNYIKSISNEDKFDEIITRLYCYGKDNIGINRYNPTGLSYVENYDWFINNGYFSSNLATAWNNYKALIASKQGQFEGYITQLEGYEASLLLKQNELAALEIEKAQIEDALDIEKNTYSSNSSTYDDLYDDLQAKEAEIEDKKDEINAIQLSINSVNNNITALQSTLNYDNNFTQEQLEELVNWIFEDTLNMSQVSDSKQLYTYALAYIEKVSQVPITFNVDSIDIFSTTEGQLDWNKINIGDFINIDAPEIGFNYYPIRLVGFNHNPVQNSLSMSFSNTDKIESDILYLNDIFKLSNKVANEVEVKKYEYERYSNDSDRIIYSGDTINVDNNPIIAGNNIITRRGFLGQDLSGYGALQILKDKIIFSNSNPLWEEYYTLLSANGLYLESQAGKSRLVITPEYGIQIDKDISGQWDNVLYIDTDGNLHIDGGYIELLTENHMNRYIMNPNDAFRIQSNIGTVASPIWQDRFFVTSDGDLVARELKTDSSINNYITLREQYIDFWNNGLKKLQIGFTDSFPYMQFGAGAGANNNYMLMTKNAYAFTMEYAVSSGYALAISFFDSDSEYPEGVIKVVGVIDFSDATVIGI